MSRNQFFWSVGNYFENKRRAWWRCHASYLIQIKRKKKSYMSRYPWLPFLAFSNHKLTNWIKNMILFCQNEKPTNNGALIFYFILLVWARSERLMNYKRTSSFRSSRPYVFSFECFFLRFRTSWPYSFFR